MYPHPAIKTLLQGFADKHQPEYLRHVTRPCAELAHAMVARLQPPQSTRQLRAFERAAAEQHGSGSSTPPTGVPPDTSPAMPEVAPECSRTRPMNLPDITPEFAAAGAARLMADLAPLGAPREGREAQLLTLANGCRGDFQRRGGKS